MLEYFYKEKRTLVDFRRGPIGPHFDSFAVYLRNKAYTRGTIRRCLGHCCQFNCFLIEKKVSSCAHLSESLLLAFVDVYLQNNRPSRCYSPRANLLASLRALFAYLIEIRAYRPPKPKPQKTIYSWLIDPYLRHLEKECELEPVTIQRAHTQVGLFLQALGKKTKRSRFKALAAEAVESYIKEHLKDSPENLQSLASALRRFFHYCAIHTQWDINKGT